MRTDVISQDEMKEDDFYQAWLMHLKVPLHPNSTVYQVFHPELQDKTGWIIFEDQVIL